MVKAPGFTLLEVLISLLLLTAAFLGCNALLTSTLQQERALKYGEEAYLFANSMKLHIEHNLDKHKDYLAQWQKEIAEELPQGQGEVDQQEIRISWGGEDVRCPEVKSGIKGCIRVVLSPKS